MNELSLFSGAGGGLLGSKILGWRTIGMVEYDPYCQKILKQRIADGILDAAPIFGDIRRFIDEGYAEPYRGRVDVLTGGFPCQPFSVAGKGAGEDDPRNMWPATIECIRIIRPRLVFLENVPGLLAHAYIRRIFGDLAESGYDCRWDVIGADDVGANHRRQRLWILAYSAEGRLQMRFSKSQSIVASNGESSNSLADDCFAGSLQSDNRRWPNTSRVRRVANDVSNRMDRLKSTGNGQVPLCMAYAYEKLSEGII